MAGGIGSGAQWKHNGPGSCCCGGTYCGCTGIPSTLHITYPLNMPGIPTATATLTFDAVTNSWLGPCLTPGTTFPTSTFTQFTFFCNNATTHAFSLEVYESANSSCSPRTGPVSLGTPNSVASPCGATFVWNGTFTIGLNTFTYVVTN
jgi:hypothetical protein